MNLAPNACILNCALRTAVSYAGTARNHVVTVDTKNNTKHDLVFYMISNVSFIP